MKAPKIAVYNIHIEPTPNNLVSVRTFIKEVKEMQLCLITSKIATKVFYDMDIVTYDLPIYVNRIKRIARKLFLDGLRVERIDGMPFNAKWESLYNKLEKDVGQYRKEA